MEHDEDAGPALEYVNVWRSGNNSGQEVGVSYCDVGRGSSKYEQPREEVDQELSAAADRQLQSYTEPWLEMSDNFLRLVLLPPVRRETRGSDS